MFISSVLFLLASFLVSYTPEWQVEYKSSFVYFLVLVYYHCCLRDYHNFSNSHNIMGLTTHMGLPVCMHYFKTCAGLGFYWSCEQQAGRKQAEFGFTF